jgi:hypothetical protein
MGKKGRTEEVDFVSGFHLKRARQAVADGDLSKARDEYRRSVNVLKHNNVTDPALFTEYEEFVKRDPIYKSLAKVFIAGLKENPGITELEMNTTNIIRDWGIRFGLGKEIEPIDRVYFMEFAEKFGYIIRESGNRIYATDGD